MISLLFSKKSYRYVIYVKMKTKIGIKKKSILGVLLFLMKRYGSFCGTFRKKYRFWEPGALYFRSRKNFFLKTFFFLVRTLLLEGYQSSGTFRRPLEVRKREKKISTAREKKIIIRPPFLIHKAPSAGGKKINKNKISCIAETALASTFEAVEMVRVCVCV